VLVVALSLFAVLTSGQFVSAKSSQFQIQVYEKLPWFYFSTLDGNKAVQNISVSFLQSAELTLTGDTPVTDSVMVIGSTVLFADLPWSVTLSAVGGNQVFEMSTTTSGKEAPGWTGLTVQLTWDGKSTQFTMEVSVKDFNWLLDNTTTTLAFFIGVSDVTEEHNVTGNSPYTQVTIAQSTISAATTAAVTNNPPSTSPAWIWPNGGDVAVLQVGNFNGTLSTMSETVTFTTTAPPHSGGMGFWDIFLIIVAVLAVLGVFGVLIAAGVGFVLYRKKQHAMMYDNI